MNPKPTKEDLQRRLTEAKVRQHEKEYEECQKLLTDHGVPEMVDFENFPGSSLSHRLKWLLTRRKTVQEYEKPAKERWEIEIEKELNENFHPKTPNT